MLVKFLVQTHILIRKVIQIQQRFLASSVAELRTCKQGSPSSNPSHVILLFLPFKPSVSFSRNVCICSQEYFFENVFPPQCFLFSKVTFVLSEKSEFRKTPFVTIGSSSIPLITMRSCQLRGRTLDRRARGPRFKAMSSDFPFSSFQTRCQLKQKRVHLLSGVLF